MKPTYEALASVIWDELESELAMILIASSPKQSLLLHDADVIDNFMSSAITLEAEIPRTSWDFNDLETYSMLVSSNLRERAKEGIK